jgi:rSAM/selenodomain-associated transferase 1
MENALVIMVKAPVPGEVKTRLASTLSPEGAAELSHCFFLDVVELAQSVSGCEVVVAYSPEDALDFFSVESLKVVKCISQGMGDLGQRMRRIFETLSDSGYAKVVLIGADLPTIPLSSLQEAFSSLKNHPVILGPSLDGGYYLLGLQDMIPEIFEGIDWGTDQVLSQSVERLSEKNIQPKRLPSWYDVDEPEELNFLIAHLELLKCCTDEHLPQHTTGFLEREGFLPKCSSESQFDDG